MFNIIPKSADVHEAPTPAAPKSTHINVTLVPRHGVPHLVKHVPASDGSEHGAVAAAAGGAASQHALLPPPLLLGVRELRGAGRGARLLLLQGLGAVQPQGAELVLGLGQAPAGRD